MKFRLNTLDPNIKEKMSKINTAQYEVFPWTFYDIVKVEGAADGSKLMPPILSFFQNERQSGVTLEQTNLKVRGRVGTPNMFWGQYIRHKIYPDYSTGGKVSLVDAADLEKSLINTISMVDNRGAAVLSVINKSYLELSPLDQIPSGVTQEGVGITTTAEGKSIAAGGNSNMSEGYPIDIWVENELQFGVEVTFSNQFPIYHSFRIAFYMDGLLIRPRNA